MARSFALAALALLMIPLGILVPGYPQLYAERELAEDLQDSGREGTLDGLKDLELRRALQKMARARGFHLSTEDVIVNVSSESKSLRPVDEISGVGYTLVLTLPVFWLFDFEIVAVRSVNINAWKVQ